MALYERDSYKTPIKTIFNHNIVEYDMKSANTSIAREFHLLPEAKIVNLENMSKKQREIAHGCIMRDTPGYSEKHKLGFVASRKLFFEMNDIRDEEVVAIKKDAIFTTRYVDIEKVTDNINFRMKNVYSSYINLGRNVEIFYKQEGLDVKGIDDEKLKSHENGTLRVIRDVYDACVEYNMDQVKINAFMKGVVDAYIHRDLEFDAYREFNNESNFRINMYGHEVLSDAITERDLSDVDISFNYLKIIIPLIKLLC